MVCPKCGSENLNDSVFCVSCGERIKEKNNSKKYLVALIIVSVVCVCTIASTIVLSVLYTKKVNEYQDLTRERDSYKSSYELVLEQYKDLNIQNKPSKEELDEIIRKQYSE